MDELLVKVASRGYGWYLVLKVAKSVLAVPLFLLYVPSLVFVCVVVATLVAAKELVTAPAAIASDAAAFWHRPWFRGFSRTYYRSLPHYARPTPEAKERT